MKEFNRSSLGRKAYQPVAAHPSGSRQLSPALRSPPLGTGELKSTRLPYWAAQWEANNSYLLYLAFAFVAGVAGIRGRAGGGFNKGGGGHESIVKSPV